jgi:hypothetical protein
MLMVLIGRRQQATENAGFGLICGVFYIEGMRKALKAKCFFGLARRLRSSR